MPDYIVIFDQSEIAYSDAAVGSNPTDASTVTSEVTQGKIAYIKADSPEAAEHAVHVAYSGSTSVPVVLEAPVEAPETVEAVEDESPADTEDVAPTDGVEDTSEDFQLAHEVSPADEDEQEPVVDEQEPVVTEPKPIVSGESVTVEPVKE